MKEGGSVEALDIKVITDDQANFYKTLFSNFDKYIEIRLIKEGKGTKQLFLTYDELLEYQPPNDVNAYVGVYERDNKFKGDKDSCTKTNVIYLDFDDETEESIRHKIDIKKIPQPTIIVNSGHGFHVYWLLEEPAGHELNPIIKKLQQTLKADPKSTDIARILRIPDTMNVKEDPVPCKLIHLNNNRSTISQFEDVLKIKRGKPIYEKITANKNPIKELLEIKHNGLNNMASGVSKGERNFCTGRITQTLKKLNYSTQEVQDIIFKWNRLNKPNKSPDELKQDIFTFWTDKRYKYDGKTFSNEGLQELNNKFVDSETIFFIGKDSSNHHNYDNDLLGDSFHKISGLTFAVLSIIKLSKSKGITLKHMAELTRRNTRDKTLLQTLNYLFKENHIHKEVKTGRATIYTFKRKPFADKRGFTSVPKLLHKLYISACEINDYNKVYDRLNETRYKLLILLESYAFDSKRTICKSNRTLADRMRVTNRTIKDNLDWLEHNQFIIFHEEKSIRHIELIY